MLLRRYGDHAVDSHVGTDMALDLEIISLLKSAHHVMYVWIWAIDSTHPWTRAGGELHALIPGFLIQGKVSPLSKIYVFCSVSPVDC